MGPALNRIGCTALTYTKDIENHQDHAHGDRRIGHVEGPEMPVTPVGIDKIEHVAGARAIDQVADRPAKHPGNAEAGEPVVQRYRGSVP